MELSGSSVVSSKDVEVDKVYRPRGTRGGFSDRGHKDQEKNFMVLQKQNFAVDRGYPYFPESSSTFQHSLGTHRDFCNHSTVFVRRGLGWQLRQESF